MYAIQKPTPKGYYYYSWISHEWYSIEHATLANERRTAVRALSHAMTAGHADETARVVPVELRVINDGDKEVM